MRKLIITISILSLLLTAALAAAVLFGHPRLSARAAYQSGPHKEIVIAVEQNINGEVSGGEVQVVFEDAAELPDEVPQALGVFLAHNGQIITLGSGSIEIMVNVEVVNGQEEVPQVNVKHSGPQISFQVGDQTSYLQDTTTMPELTAADIKAGQVIVPGTVAAGSLSDILALVESGEQLVLRVYGEYQDGVLLADLVVYEVIK